MNHECEAHDRCASLAGSPVLLVSAPAQQPSQSRITLARVLTQTCIRDSRFTSVPSPPQPRQAEQDYFFRGPPGTSIPDGQKATYVINPLASDEDPLAQWVNELSRKLTEVKSDSEKSEIKSQLPQTLEKQFDLRQKRHQDEIAKLEAKVKQLKDLVDKRRENRREIIDKRLEQIFRDAEGLGLVIVSDQQDGTVDKK